MKHACVAIVAALLLAGCSKKDSGETSAPMPKAWQKLTELDTQLSDRLVQARVVLGWRDAANRLAVAQGQMNAQQADQDLRDYGQQLFTTDFTDQEFGQEHRRLEAAAGPWLDGIGQAAAASQSWPGGGAASLWRPRAQRHLDSIRRDLPDWLAEQLDPLPLLEQAAQVAAWTQGQAQATNPFAGHAARVLAAFPGPARSRIYAGTEAPTSAVATSEAARPIPGKMGGARPIPGEITGETRTPAVTPPAPPLGGSRNY